MKKKNALVIAACDGIVCMYSGVGVIVNFFFESFDKIKTGTDMDDYDLYAATTYLSSSCPDYDASVYETVKKICRNNGGDLSFIHTLISGEILDEIWGGDEHTDCYTQWSACSRSLAVYCNTLYETGQYEHVFLIAHDTIFAETSKYVRHDAISVCWVPHSLSSLFNDRFSGTRLPFEENGMLSILDRDDTVGYISNQTREALLHHHQIPEDNIVPFDTGVYFDSKKYNIKGNSLKDFNIPAHKKLLFSWGRCVHQKGIDLILEGLNSCFKTNRVQADNYHLLLLCPTLTSPPEYLDRIYSLLETLPCSYTFITAFHNNLAVEVLQHPHTELIMLASRFEGFGITAIEALVFSHKNAKIIYAPLPTFGEVFETNENFIKAEAHTGEAYAAAAELLLNKEQHAIKRKNINKFNFVENYITGLRCMFNSINTKT